MVVAKRKSKTFPDRWKIIYTLREDIPPSHARVMDAMTRYMFNKKTHVIHELEYEVMNAYEEESAMNRLDGLGVWFKWVCIAKQHVPPHSERYCFAIYSGKTLLAAVFEPSEFQGRGVKRMDYRP